MEEKNQKINCTVESCKYNDCDNKIWQISQSQDAGAPAPGAPRNQRPRELTGHLTIKTFWDEQMETIIQDFTALHPGVKIGRAHV